MNWEAAGAVGEILGAIGVIISLLYLAAQIRSDARARRATAIHEQSESFSRVLRDLATSPQLSEVYFRGINDPNALEGEELVRFNAWLGVTFRAYEDSLFQYEAGTLDSRVWHGLEGPVSDLLAYPGVQHFWSRRGHHYSEHLQAHVKEKLAVPRTRRLYDEPAA